ncbi:MAG: hypothetical protein EAY70_04230 [Sphingomonadales bacterium]|nr:MAG: hypothetical protein EAY70_04230 [Sphingomonadales bacterium]
MLKRFESRAILGSLSYLAQTERMLLEGRRQMPHNLPYFQMGKTAHLTVSRNLDNFIQAGQDYDLAGLKAASENCKNLFLVLKPEQQINLEELDYLIESLQAVRNIFMYGIKEQGVYVMTRGAASAYNDAADGFGDRVRLAFPSSSFDIEEAIKCRSLELWTASVTHLMRALDPPLLAFQTYLAVPCPKENWQNILDQIDAAIKSKGHKAHDHQWNSEASAHFRILKDAWRNHAMHGKDRYDESRATTIFESVRGFITHLAERLGE